MLRLRALEGELCPVLGGGREAEQNASQDGSEGIPPEGEKAWGVGGGLCRAREKSGI